MKPILKNSNYSFARFFWLILMSFFTLISSCSHTHKKIEIRGIYGNPKPLWEKDLSLAELGINAIFVHSGSIDQYMMDRAKQEGVNVYAEFATLNGKNYVEKHPEAWAIDNHGKKVTPATWFMGVCPTEPEFKNYRKDLLRKLLQSYDIKGVWLDYVHWHAQFEDINPILPETCFCDRCVEQFSKETGVTVKGENTNDKAAWILANEDTSWRNWRCQVIFQWTLDMKEVIKEENPEVLLGLYHCPWNDEEYKGARRRILGLDYSLLKNSIDVFSPMVYHGRMEREPQWVADNISWFSKSLGIKQTGFPKLWPIVQAHNDPDIISPAEFGTVLKGGLSANSKGIMMFTTYAVAEDEGKIEKMKHIYLKIRDDQNK
jgi:hypothetical protein